ncbi:MAG: hypothetical protein DHS80DRAFT_22272 [Piptocephalis tieghemiana]|nr:MAG: hypothetical protein DHS80DRAFT_22272 [Piptocephalis tieghemiana]
MTTISADLNRSRILNITFSGGEGEDVEKFITSLRIQSQVRRWTSEEHYEMMVTCLSGDALDLLGEVSEESWEDLESLKELLRVRFKRWMSLERAYRRIHEISMAPTEDYVKVYKELEEVRRMATMKEESILVRAYISAMCQPEIRQYLLDQPPTSLKAAFDNTQRKVATIKEMDSFCRGEWRGSPQKQANQEDGAKGRTDGPKDQMSELINKMDQLVLVTQGRSTRERERSQDMALQKWRGQSASSGESGQGRKSTIGCYRCRGPHLIRNCPEMVCHFCNKAGHMSGNCPVKEKREDEEKRNRSGNGRERH